MKVDSHHHLWNLQAVDYPWLMDRGTPRFFGDPTPIQRDYLVGEFQKDASGCGIQASVHIQVGASDPIREAQWVDSIAQSNPSWPAAQVAFCDLTQDGAEARVAELAAFPSVRGVRQIVGRSAHEDALTGSNQLLLNEKFRRGLQILSRWNMTFDLQLVPSLLESATDLFSQVPLLPVALCHAGSPCELGDQGFARWKRGIVEFSSLPLAFCKLSGFGMFKRDWRVRDLRPIVEMCLDCFGPDRCMFGSNFPVDSLSSTYSTIVSAYEGLVPREHHDAFFGQNAVAFYNLRTPGNEMSGRDESNP